MRGNRLRPAVAMALSIATAAQAISARAADKLAFGPPAGWVDTSVAPAAGDEGLVFDRAWAASGHRRLTMRFFGEAWNSDVGHPDLYRSQPLAAKSSTVFSHPLSNV